jgi:TRAP-type C4-dicarboxylate transport system permease large subunit
MMANVSIGALFVAGILPGIVLTVLMMLTVAYHARRQGWGGDVAFHWGRLGGATVEILLVLAFPMAVWLAVKAGASVNVAALSAFVVLLVLDWRYNFSAVLALMAPVILIGGMTMGWFTPTEAAVAAVLWALFLGLVRYRSMTLKTLAKATFDTIETTASVLFIVTAASIFAWLLTTTQAAQALADWILSITSNKWMFLLLANLLILFVGCFIDTIAAITILVPILLPIVLKLGIDPVQFGLIVTLNLMIGLMTPPLGMVLFVLARISKLSVERATMAILPWLIPLLLGLVLLCLAACQSVPGKVGNLTEQQVAALKEVGFVQDADDWVFSASDKLLFGSNEAELTEEAKQTVYRITHQLMQAGITAVRVDGHTDATGSRSQNQQLSQR